MLKSMMKTKTACASFYAFLLVLLCMSMEIQSHGTYVCVQLLGYISRGVPWVSHELLQSMRKSVLFRTTLFASAKRLVLYGREISWLFASEVYTPARREPACACVVRAFLCCPQKRGSFFAQSPFSLFVQRSANVFEFSNFPPMFRNRS